MFNSSTFISWTCFSIGTIELGVVRKLGALIVTWTAWMYNEKLISCVSHAPHVINFPLDIKTFICSIYTLPYCIGIQLCHYFLPLLYCPKLRLDAIANIFSCTYSTSGQWVFLCMTPLPFGVLWLKHLLCRWMAITCLQLHKKVKIYHTCHTKIYQER